MYQRRGYGIILYEGDDFAIYAHREDNGNMKAVIWGNVDAALDSAESNRLPVRGAPNTSSKMYDSNGNLVKERVYGSDGAVIRDIFHRQQPVRTPPRPEPPAPPPATTGSYTEFLDALGFRESSDRYSATSSSGTFLGRYQMGPMALQDAGFMNADGSWTTYARQQFGIRTTQDFLNSPEAQEAAIRAFHQRLWRSIQNWGWDKLIGTVFTGRLAGSTEEISVVITASGLLAAAHLVGTSGTSARGSLSTMLQTGIIPVDGNGTPATEYLGFEGFDLTELLDWIRG
jgi:hypothetical protein